MEDSNVANQRRTLHVYLSPKARAKLREMADEAGVSVTSVVERWVLDCDGFDDGFVKRCRRVDHERRRRNGSQSRGA